MTDHAEATNFDGLPLKERPDLRTDGARRPGDFVLCPKCHGHGYWNIRPHLKQFCRQCWGWGWVEAGSLDARCIHTFVESAPDQPWRCWHTIRCTQCGATKSYDSSG